jgi:3-hydroxypropanoate dehydrogenase
MTVDQTTALRAMFLDARSQNGWRADAVDDADLQAAYEIARWGPTSANCQPMRLAFLRTAEAKARIEPALAPGNVAKAMSAPVLAIVAYDTAFHTEMPRLFPHRPDAGQRFADSPDLAAATAARNGTLQAAYFMLALRAVGLDVGPMSGFDANLVDATFFTDSSWRTNFLCGIGRGDPEKVLPRLPRLDFADVAQSL